MSEHRCLVFESETGRAAAGAAFVRDGLAAGEKVLYFCATEFDRTVAALAAREVDPQRYLASGQLDLRRAWDAYLDPGPFDADRVLDLLDREITEASRQWSAGFRIAGEMSWAPSNNVPTGRLLDYEDGVTDLLARRGASALCLYDRHTFDPEQVAAAEQVHPSAVADEVVYDDGMLRIASTLLPPGLRLTGDVDLSNEQALRDALAAAVQQHHGDLYLDVTGLTFIDVAGARALVSAAGNGKGPSRVVLDSPRSIVKRVLSLGWGEPPNVVMYEDGTPRTASSPDHSGVYGPRSRAS